MFLFQREVLVDSQYAILTHTLAIKAMQRHLCPFTVQCQFKLRINDEGLKIVFKPELFSFIKTEGSFGHFNRNCENIRTQTEMFNYIFWGHQLNFSFRLLYFT